MPQARIISIHPKQDFKNSVMETHQITMTPSQAKDLLEKNSGNRKLRPTRVAFFAECIKRGEWTLTHQGIAIAPSGRLLDGQHRLAAVVEANMSVPMMVTFDVPESAFVNMDRNAPRTIADVLRLPGPVVALAGLLHRIAAGETGNTKPLSATQVQDAYTRFAAYIDPVVAVTSRKSARSSAGIRAGCIARMVKGEGEHALASLQAFARLDFDGMPAVCKALLKQIDAGNIGRRDGEREIIVRAWIAFDPKRAHLDTITYKDFDLNWNEVTDLIASVK